MTLSKQYKLAIMGDCATQHLAAAIGGYGAYTGLGLDIFDADYNQINALVMDSQSELYEFAPDAVLLQMCSQKLYERFCAVPLEERSSFAEKICTEMKGIWKKIGEKITILQFSTFG